MNPIRARARMRELQHKIGLKVLDRNVGAGSDGRRSNQGIRRIRRMREGSLE
jgi:hypothetical protein